MATPKKSPAKKSSKKATKAKGNAKRYAVKNWFFKWKVIPFSADEAEKAVRQEQILGEVKAFLDKKYGTKFSIDKIKWTKSRTNPNGYIASGNCTPPATSTKPIKGPGGGGGVVTPTPPPVPTQGGGN